MNRADLVHWVHSSRSNLQLQERYDQWARSYETDLNLDFGWIGPRRAVESFQKYVPKNRKILDAGAGTGLLGELLFRNGYEDLVTIDLSSGMLDEARKKGIYNELYEMTLGENMDFPNDYFGAVGSVGVLTVGHPPPDSFDELIRVTMPGGYIIFTLIPDLYQDGGFREKQTHLEDSEKWRLTEVSERFQDLPRGEPEIYHQVWTYKINP